MKIFFKVMSFSGGAPLSMLEYIKLLKQAGNEIFVSGKYSNCEGRFIEEGIIPFNLPPFDIHQPIRNLKVYWMLTNELKKIEPDFLVFWTGYESIFGKLVSRYFGLPALYVYVGGEMVSYMRQVMRDEHILVFSEENRSELIAQGYNSSRIDVVTNRLSIKPVETKDQCHLHLNQGETLKLLLPSRLDSSKIASIQLTIEIAERLYRTFGNLLQLDIAGDGECYNQVKQMASQANLRAGGEFVYVLGYVNNMKPLFLQAHIVFGKGRSVIEPLMMGRLGIVVGEDRKMSLCTNDTILNLAKFNFSGRSITNHLEYKELESIVEALIAGTYDFTKNTATSAQVQLMYDIRYAGKHIETIIAKRIEEQKELKQKKKLRLIIGVVEYIRVYSLAVVSKIIKILRIHAFKKKV